MPDMHMSISMLQVLEVANKSLDRRPFATDAPEVADGARADNRGHGGGGSGGGGGGGGGGGASRSRSQSCTQYSASNNSTRSLSLTPEMAAIMRRGRSSASEGRRRWEADMLDAGGGGGGDGDGGDDDDDGDGGGGGGGGGSGGGSGSGSGSDPSSRPRFLRRRGTSDAILQHVPSSASPLAHRAKPDPNINTHPHAILQHAPPSGADAAGSADAAESAAGMARTYAASGIGIESASRGTAVARGGLLLSEECAPAVDLAREL